MVKKIFWSRYSRRIEGTQNVLSGRPHKIIDKIALRDRPLLDEYQDAIFRLPIDTQVAILGPPGTGKTTTLIKRLGLKTDASDEILSRREKRLVEKSVAGLAGLSTSWLMFTPTELLRQYVKEAFARENLPAPDTRIKTWDDYRRELARESFGILRSARRRGASMRAELDNLSDHAIQHQTEWFDDFNGFQSEDYWSDLSFHARRLAGHSKRDIAGTRRPAAKRYRAEWRSRVRPLGCSPRARRSGRQRDAQTSRRSEQSAATIFRSPA